MYHKKDNLGAYYACLLVFKSTKHFFGGKKAKRFYHFVIELELAMKVSKKWFDANINKNISNNKYGNGVELYQFLNFSAPSCNAKMKMNQWSSVSVIKETSTLAGNCSKWPLGSLLTLKSMWFPVHKKQ